MKSLVQLLAIILLLLVGCPASGQDREVDYTLCARPSTGRIFLHARTEDTWNVNAQVNAVELLSHNGVLIPPDSPEPFSFLITSSPDAIVWGRRGSTVEIDGWIELAGFDVSRVGDGYQEFDYRVVDRFGTYDAPGELLILTPPEGWIEDWFAICATSPEPAGLQIAGLSVMWLLVSFRRRRPRLAR
jgi:hypothetical protein